MDLDSRTGWAYAAVLAAGLGSYAFFSGPGAPEPPAPVAAAVAPAPAVLFSPKRGGAARVVGLVGGAKKEVRMAAYSLTHEEIISSLVWAKRRGADVAVVVDPSSTKAALQLKSHSVPVRVDSRHHIMHNKYLVLDGKTVETGSFNYTKSADESNAENVLVLAGQPALAAEYLKDWKEHWDHGRDPE
jgi:phosphatidylserine/phosphatidylglycerophosphate/cardiolipin synthase-like enzyme